MHINVNNLILHTHTHTHYIEVVILTLNASTIGDKISSSLIYSNPKRTHSKIRKCYLIHI